MKNSYNQKLDRLITHDYPGLHGPQVTQFIMDELELGARVALALDEEDQAWWNLIGDDLYLQEFGE